MMTTRRVNGSEARAIERQSNGLLFHFVIAACGPAPPALMPHPPRDVPDGPTALP